MTMTIEAPADTALKNVARKVTRMIPRGFGGEKFWRMTLDECAALEAAHRVCKLNDTDENRDVFRGAAQDWVAAWSRAIEAWKDENLP